MATIEQINDKIEQANTLIDEISIIANTWIDENQTSKTASEMWSDLHSVRTLMFTACIDENFDFPSCPCPNSRWRRSKTCIIKRLLKTKK